MLKTTVTDKQRERSYYPAPSEFVDISISRIDDSGHQHFISEKGSTTCMSYKYKDQSFLLYSYTPIYILHDLDYILFRQTMFPWIDNKYEKRLIRWCVFFSLSYYTIRENAKLFCYRLFVFFRHILAQINRTSSTTAGLYKAINTFTNNSIEGFDIRKSYENTSYFNLITLKDEWHIGEYLIKSTIVMYLISTVPDSEGRRAIINKYRSEFKYKPVDAQYYENHFVPHFKNFVSTMIERLSVIAFV